MAAASIERARDLRQDPESAALAEVVSAMPPPPRLALSPTGFDLIAEIKMTSPSAGVLSADFDAIEKRAGVYARAGAVAVSVLTEPDRFGGSLSHLRRAAAVLDPLGIPTMAKDFIVDPVQVCASRAAGAGGVLLIVRILEDDVLADLLELTGRLGMFTLLEAFDETDLDRAAAILQGQSAVDQLLLGLNCRDLQTLAIEPARFSALADRFPNDYPRVAESGMATADDVRMAAQLGYGVSLVGTALMRCDDPSGLIAGMLAAGRGAAGQRT
ncbi:MAG: indole-3-glycerol-phosphate synthase [Gammaproteobacteria bacterium]|nr:MAG: indole-3-glycerol-phosphate synthase [Gammaproteobacteria bacterium]